MGRTVSKLDSMILCCSGKGSSDRRRVRIRVRSILNSKSPEKSDGESWWKSCKGSEAENCKRESLDKRWCKADSYRIVEITAQIKGEFRSLGCSSARFQWGEKLFFGRERRDRKQNTIVPSRMMVFHNTQVKVSQSRANSLFLWSCFSRLSYGWKLSVWNPTGYFKNTFQTLIISATSTNYAQFSDFKRDLFLPEYRVFQVQNSQIEGLSILSPL